MGVEIWAWAVIGILFIVILFLLLKIHLLHKAADEIAEELDEKLHTDTNTLITVSTRDRHMRSFAARLNAQLRLLRAERRRFQSGDLELKEAVTNISHDLRTPLTAICGYLDLLEREEKSEAAERYLRMIENRTEMLRQLTEELFRYSVITSSAEELSLESLSLNSVLEESLSAYYAALKKTGITPEIRMPEESVRRTLDRGHLSRIFGNILSNAIKYSDGDLSVTLCDTGEITFSNYAHSLTPVTAGRLFDRFFTVETGRSSTGLGLSIAKLLTEQMGGTITASYEDGRLIIALYFP